MGEPTRPPIADVRRRLNELRAMWKAHSLARPFFATAPLSDGTPAADFAFEFVAAHHRRRTTTTT